MYFSFGEFMGDLSTGLINLYPLMGMRRICQVGKPCNGAWTGFGWIGMVSQQGLCLRRVDDYRLTNSAA